MPDQARRYLIRQFETASTLAAFHLDGLTTEECLWRPAERGLHVRRGADGHWHADWPEHEGYDIGPPSIAWLSWHLGFWWSMVLNHSLGDASLTREAVVWPGTADALRAWLNRLQSDWAAYLGRIDDDDLRSAQLTRWPLKDRPFGDVVAWVNIELMKNAAEIGYARFLYAARANARPAPLAAAGAMPEKPRNGD